MEIRSAWVHGDLFNTGKFANPDRPGTAPSARIEESGRAPVSSVEDRNGGLFFIWNSAGPAGIIAGPQ